MAELIVALDTAALDPALDLVDRLQPHVRWFKVGLELFSASGPPAVKALRARGCSIFLDLKFLDIPNTVQAASRVAAAMGVAMITVHLSGGQRMIQAAVQGSREGASSHTPPPKVLGVTMLTSLNQADISWMGRHDLGDLAIYLAEQGMDWGVHGVICSALEVARIKNTCGSSCLCVTPGIRPASESKASDDQSRVATPSAAVAAGSDFLVVGRPITAADDPIRATKDVLHAMAWPNQARITHAPNS